MGEENVSLVIGHFSVGAFADSAHEYLLKQWLLTSKTETKARDLCSYSPLLANLFPRYLRLTQT